ncbi:AAA family ATPase [Streptomyces sp. ME19-01-6]|uniref:AAA family ATPase n=1 Tax=Streptomyces sp. ME19-01-6 TaxID=3028686 RepID=UPI0029BB5F74|nr:AAA family ATPase [Streptomyces sp. ME19-01-6]MDX3233701.1 AAA family ATPase [Streptomyces sp. ME19-01-6]
MQLSERGHAFAELNHMLMSSEKGTGHLALVSGPTSSGKTEIIHTFAKDAIDNGALFLSATGSQTEKRIPLGVVTQLFESTSTHTDVANEIRQLLKDYRSAPMPSESGDNATDPLDNDILEHITSAVSKLAERQMILVGVDDIHHADTQSLQVVLWLSRRLRSIPAMFLFAEQEYCSEEYMEFRSELLCGNVSTRIELRPLTVKGVAELLTFGMEAGVACQLSRACHDFSGGNPLLVRALIEDNSSITEDPDEPVVGNAYGRAVLECLRRCALNHALDVARGIAVLGEHSTHEILSTLLSISSFTVGQVIDTLTRMGILLNGRLRHSRARTAILNDMTPADHASLHQRASTIAYSHGLPPMPIAHFLLAANHHDEPWADDLLSEAAGIALGQGKVSFAIECLRLACGSQSDVERHPEKTANLAAAEWRANPMIAARRHNVLIPAVQDGKLSEHRTAELVRALLWLGQFDEAVGIVQQLVQRGSKPSPELYAWLRVSYPELMNRLLNELHLTELPAIPPSPDSAESLLAQSLAVGRLSGAAGMANQILQNRLLDDQSVNSLESALLALMYSGEADQAASWCDSLLAEAAKLRAPTWQARFSAVRSEIALRQGSSGSAEDFASMALDYIPLQSWGVVVGAPLGSLIRAMTAQGRYHAAGKWLTESVPATMFETRFGLNYQYARGEYYLATGRADLAFEEFLMCGRRVNEWGLSPSVFLPECAPVTTAMSWLGHARLADQDKKMLATQMTRAYPGSATVRGKSTEPADVLSGAEYRVAELASAGHTNREISRKLCITTSTVEQHLTRAYRKLKVKNRSQLTQVLTAQPDQ